MRDHRRGKIIACTKRRFSSRFLPAQVCKIMIFIDKMFAIVQRSIKVGCCLHAPEIHVSFFQYCFLLTMTMNAGMWYEILVLRKYEN